jgi:hypothetical protein
MGTAYNRSWSFSRQSIYKRCPRAFFYEYFPWGEPNQNEIVINKRITTLPLLIGQVAHRTIAMALRQFKRNAFVYPDLTKPALIDFNARVKQSERIYPFVKRGNEPPNKQVVLQHHINTGPSQYLEDCARTALVGYIRAFEESEAFEVLRFSDRDKWEYVNSDSDTKRTVEASRALGFKRAFGLQLYTDFDLAFRYRGDFIIVDWKTGKKTEATEAAARKQTIGYSLWARELGIQPEVIRIQPFWLANGESWNPQPFEESELDAVRSEIEEQDAVERSLIRKQLNDKGREVHLANIEDFPAQPSWTCKNCKFRSICPEGSAQEKPN